MGLVGDVSNDLVYQVVWDKFLERENALLAAGYLPINPMRVVPRGTDWVTAMKLAIPAMLACDKVSPLPDTWISKGGMMEFNLSQQLKMSIVIPEDQTEIN